MNELDSKNITKGNIEIEGLEVPEDDVIKLVIEKYKEKLGSEAVDSLLYSISEGTKIMVMENENKSRRSTR